ncbi:hypothetical protein NP233_g1561 [Leucocoprinus birnbaumii]|uniref:Reverse transcriptase domain-containing protein n=1 Tax=Leucocoprinus birnbaumii TaxID=56174 RepID=A0AAD5YUR4_9AGAR|nr:hypothetical protein NP233_g1561 [Leucocoprinus birnbaumii]
MPLEWNLMSNDMANMNANQNSHLYQALGIKEISLPQPFSATPVREKFVEFRRLHPIRIPELKKDAFDEMKQQFEPKRTLPKEKAPPDKGKRKALYTEQKLEHLHNGWYEEYADIMQGPPNQLPPFREVNHEINLIDDKKLYHYRMPRCPNSMRSQFHEKLLQYTNAGWWEFKSVSQAAPLMCIPKKNGELRTVVDARPRNENTVKDVTPLPDQEVIREDVARAKFRSKIDLSNAYEQVRVVLRDVDKTAFSTIQGTMISHIMQQGDCNAPATSQRLMTAIFRDALGLFVHVYLDDIFIYSETLEDHQRHLRFAFDKLRENQLYIKKEKCDLYAEKIDCLGHIITDEGIYPDMDKLARIRDWHVPRNYNDVQRFIGLINYLANFLPDISTYTGPLLAITQNGMPFHWRPIHQKCFDTIKAICCKTPILKPIDPKSKEPIWVICDASKTGIGAVYGQGPTWDQCRPAGIMSQKFTAAQQNYAVHEMETLAILEALMKWEDKLVGYPIHIITDHKALEFFNMQSKLSRRQYRWTEYLSRFAFDITYVKGEDNKIADCLSRYFENDKPGELRTIADYVNADRRIDPENEDLPDLRKIEVDEHIIELRSMCTDQLRWSNRLREKQEERQKEAEIMKEAEGRIQMKHNNQPQPTIKRKSKPKDPHTRPELTLGEALQCQSQKPHEMMDQDMFREQIRKCYSTDTLFKTVIAKAEDHPRFSLKDNILYTRNIRNEEVVCIPND